MLAVIPLSVPLCLGVPCAQRPERKHANVSMRPSGAISRRSTTLCLSTWITRWWKSKILRGQATPGWLGLINLMVGCVCRCRWFGFFLVLHPIPGNVQKPTVLQRSAGRCPAAKLTASSPYVPRYRVVNLFLVLSLAGAISTNPEKVLQPTRFLLDTVFHTYDNAPSASCCEKPVLEKLLCPTCSRLKTYQRIF
jgi:hypothetical protein